MKPFLGHKPLVLDRKFSHLAWMQTTETEHVNFLIRPKGGATFSDQEGQRISSCGFKKARNDHSTTSSKWAKSGSM
ncbi:hypothetical protein SE15_05900 [Thermanaerothrix daxensis]|uniref:Uncharacterized protein n=1 Tax=Thermanaerothrix daxensis TaxID=869279 RepID=A0A0N8GQT5_9CHLR|nr:hypothetical protein SE15_05900 [Thermanaerothrix daxensis]